MDPLYLIRCELCVVAGSAEDEVWSPSTSRVLVYRYRYPVLSSTKMGHWISVYGKRKWVNSHSRKRFAYPTVAEADESFRCRQRRRALLLRTQLKHVEVALSFGTDRYTDLNGLEA